MGRVKLKIKRLESTSNRQVTYSKRRNGILKKARELSILCDVDIVLLMFSPTGRPTLFHGERSRTEEVIAKFAQVSPQERAKRKLESLEALKKTFKKLDHDVIVQDFLGASSQTVEELQNQVQLLQAQVAEVHRRLSYWSNPVKVENIEHLSQMEHSLRESIDRIHLHKENMAKHQVVPLGCTGLSGTTLPLVMSNVQAGQTLSWFSNNDNQRMILPNVPNFLPPRNMACSRDDFVPGFTGYFGLGKLTEVASSGQFDNTGHEGSALNDLSSSGGALTELSSSGSLSLQPSEQYSYPPYSTLNLLQDKQSKHEMEMNVHGNPGVNEVDSNYALPGSTYDTGHDAWIPASGHCGIAMFDEKSYHQQPN